jgi:hypothetical protein
MNSNKSKQILSLICPVLLLIGLSSLNAESPNYSLDWLIDPSPYKSTVIFSENGKSIILENGLISRVIRLKPNLATVDFRNLTTGEAIIRALRPEGIIELDNIKYKVGGLEGQVEQAYILSEWIDDLKIDPNAFQYVKYDIGQIEKRFEWKRKRWAANLPWPPPGKSVMFSFTHPSKKLKDIMVEVYYEIYDGIPLISKWMKIKNNSNKIIRLNSFITEKLAVIEPEVNVETPKQWKKPNLHVESNYAFHGMTPESANKTIFWQKDSLFTSQVNYRFETPCLLECKPPIGPNISIQPGKSFKTFRIFELIYDSTDKERNGLALRRMYRTISPWTTENPIFMHLTTINEKKVKVAIDQCVEVGFEMIILSFGSGLRMEKTDPDYLSYIKSLVNYAHQGGIEFGGYSLLASRKISEKDDVINPNTGETGGTIFGNSPCLGSEWGIDYFEKIKKFIIETGFDILEHDGSYPGDMCASTKHPGHENLYDSQWKQWQKITYFYKWCREYGVYLNVPDWYFLSGSNKTGIGYREVNWSLPRERQIILGRQNIFDGTWYKIPSMGWTFVPLVQYHGGGDSATLEPLVEHLVAYESHLVQNFGSGVQACYRGSRLYDTEKTKNLVKKWVSWYKKYRDILNSDIIHIRRPDGRDFDGILHVNPALKEKGLLMIYNPTNKNINKTIFLPLYYSGLSKIANIREREGPTKPFVLDRNYHVMLPISVKAGYFNWYVIK